MAQVIKDSLRNSEFGRLSLINKAQSIWSKNLFSSFSFDRVEYRKTRIMPVFWVISHIVVCLSVIRLHSGINQHPLEFRNHVTGAHSRTSGISCSWMAHTSNGSDWNLTCLLLLVSLRTLPLKDGRCIWFFFIPFKIQKEMMMIMVFYTVAAYGNSKQYTVHSGLVWSGLHRLLLLPLKSSFIKFISGPTNRTDRTLFETLEL